MPFRSEQVILSIGKKHLGFYLGTALLFQSSVSSVGLFLFISEMMIPARITISKDRNVPTYIMGEASIDTLCHAVENIATIT